MAVPTWATNQVLLASDVNNWFVPLVGYKTATLGRSTNTKSADPDMQFSVAASAVYEVRAGFNWLAVAGIGFTWNFTVPSGAGGAYQISYANTNPVIGITWATAETAGSNGAPNYGAVLNGILTTSSSGTFSFNWASGTNSSLSTIGIGSYLLARRIG